MGGIISILLLWLLVDGDAFDTFEYCGPDKRCKCSPVSSSRPEMEMDCSGINLTSICVICNNSAMENVTQLDVSDNRIGSIEGRACVSACQRLQALDLRNNTLTIIDETVFETINGLLFLDLSLNNLTVYKKESGKLFKNLTSLKTLMLNGNLLNQGESNHSYPDLSNITSLVSLSMDGLRDAKFDSSFQKLTNLTGLFLSGLFGKCDLGDLKNDSFQYLQHIKMLCLSYCNISNIDLLSFALPNLKWLDLSHNQQLGFETLNNVSYGLQFSDITFLNYSYVYNTFRMGTLLKRKNICYLYNTSLQELALDNNNIEEFENNVPLLFPSTLQVLHASFNMLRFGPYLFQMVCVENLTELYGSFRNIGRNTSLYFLEHRYPAKTAVYLETCPFMDDEKLINRSKAIQNCNYIPIDQAPAITIFQPAVPKSLKRLVIANSALKYEVSKLYVKEPNNIEYMDFSGNTLFSWEGPLFNFNHLKNLNLANNYCTKISKQFLRTYTSLENLQASGNLIGLSLENTSVTGQFQDLANLKVLNLSLNRISTMNSKTFYGLKNLESMDLSFNNIQEWTLEVDDLSNLTHINLSHNSVQKLPKSLTNHMSVVSRRRGIPFTVDLQKNNLKVSCDALSFLKWMAKHRNNCIGFDEYMFVDDDGFTINHFDIDSQIDELEKKCRSNVLWVVLSTVGVSTCMSIVVGGLIYRNRWKMRYFLYMSKQRFYGYVRIPNQEPLENFRYNAFISFAEENLRFVRDEVIPRLEDGDSGITLCIHQRNFLPGNTIAENIVDAIQSSRKTVILLTKAFLKRRWCMYEFNMTRMENIYNRDGRSCLVVVMLENVPAKDMPLQMLELIKTESYIEYNTDVEDQGMFWDNLRDAILT